MTLKTLASSPDELFWSEQFDFDSDFKMEDPLALDYLAQQIGLWLFPSFTTRTNRAQYYAMVLYGLYLSNRAVKEYGYPGNDETRVRLFERWERFWALATLQYRDGELERGDEDAMRGILGARRAWLQDAQDFDLDFQLISRQSELGGLGAYLSSLRSTRLVASDSLLVTPSAREILNSFWTEPRQQRRNPRYEDYALQALDLSSRKIAVSRGQLTLKNIGRKSRLSTLVRESRREQQKRLWVKLFVESEDECTLPLANQLIEAHRQNVSEPEDLLKGMKEKQFGTLPSGVTKIINAALTFGTLARELLSRFDRAYGYVNEHGWVANFNTVAASSFPSSQANHLRALCERVLSDYIIERFQALTYHGPGFLSLVRRLRTSGSVESLSLLLEFHQEVQRSRRGGGAWLRSDDEKLMLQVAGYGGYTSQPDFPGFKFKAVKGILSDLGKLSHD